METAALLEALNQRKASTDSPELQAKIEELESMIAAKKAMGSKINAAEAAVEEEIGLRRRSPGSKLPPNVKEAMDQYLREQMDYMHDQVEEQRRQNQKALEQQKEAMAKDLRKVRYDMVEQAVGAADDFRNGVDNALIDTDKEIETEEQLVLGIQQQLLNGRKLESVRKEIVS